jgi:hypothetical protein
MTSLNSLSFYSAFCFEGHAAVHMAANLSAAEIAEKKDLTDSAMESRQRAKTANVATFIFADIVACIPIVAQIRGICTILSIRLFAERNYIPGSHEFRQGLIMRGILEFLNLGPILLITDLALSILRGIQAVGHQAPSNK